MKYIRNAFVTVLCLVTFFVSGVAGSVLSNQTSLSNVTDLSNWTEISNWTELGPFGDGLTIIYSLLNVLSPGNTTFSTGDATTTALAFSESDGLQLITLPANVPASEGMRLSYDTSEGATLSTSATDDFSSSTGWALDADATVSGGALNIAATSLSRGQKDFSLVAGSRYTAEWTVSNTSGSRAYTIDNAGIGGTVQYETGITATNGAYSTTFTADNGYIRFIAGAGSGTFSIDDLTIKEITPAWLNSVSSSDSTALHPVNADGHYVEHPQREDSTAYTAGDYYWMESSSAGHNLYAKCTGAGTSAASAPSVALTDTTYSDGTATFSVQGRYNNTGEVPFVRGEPSATNYVYPGKDFTSSQWTATDCTKDTSTKITFDAVAMGRVSAPSAIAAVEQTISAQFSSGDVGKSVRFGYYISSWTTSDDLVIPSSGVVSYTFTPASTTVAIGVINATAATSQSVELSGRGVQHEQGAVYTSYIPTTTSTVTRPATSQTVANPLSDYVQCRVHPEVTTAHDYLSDGTNVLSYDGTNYSFTDGTTTLTYAATPAKGDVLGVDTVAGKLYVNGTLRDTDAALDVTWGATLTIGEHGGVTDLDTWSSDPDLTDITEFDGAIIWTNDVFNIAAADDLVTYRMAA